MFLSLILLLVTVLPLMTVFPLMNVWPARRREGEHRGHPPCQRLGQSKGVRRSPQKSPVFDKRQDEGSQYQEVGIVRKRCIPGMIVGKQQPQGEGSFRDTDGLEEISFINWHSVATAIMLPTRHIYCHYELLWTEMQEESLPWQQEGSLRVQQLMNTTLCIYKLFAH